MSGVPSAIQDGSAMSPRIKYIRYKKSTKLAKRAVSKAFSSVGSVARLLVPHMSLDAAAGSARASLIWSNNLRNGFENELFHCEFVLVVGIFTEQLFMAEYNGEHVEWMEEIHFPAPGDVLIVDAREPVQTYLGWQPVWLPETAEWKFVHPAIIARLDVETKCLGVLHVEEDAMAEAEENIHDMEEAQDVNGYMDNIEAHIGTCNLVVKCKMSHTLIKRIASGLRRIWTKRSRSVCWYCKHGKHRSRVCAYVASMMCFTGRFVEHPLQWKTYKYCKGHHCYNTRWYSRADLSDMITTVLQEATMAADFHRPRERHL